MKEQNKPQTELAAELEAAQRRIAQLETLLQLKETAAPGSKKIATAGFDEEALRQAAEARLARDAPSGDDSTMDEFSSTTLIEIIQELRIHHVELEMQNEELRRTQYELDRTQQKYANLYTFAPVGYLTFDNDGAILELNLMAAQLLGEKRQRLKQKPLLVYLEAESIMVFQRHLQETLNSDAAQTCDLTLKQLSGTRLDVQVQSVAVYDDQGQRNRVWTTFTDVTKLKQIERELIRQRNQLEIRTNQISAVNQQMQQEIAQHRETTESLRRSEARFRTLVDSMDDIVFLLDTEQRHTEIFGRWLETAGLPAAFFLGKTSREIMGPDAAAPHEAANAKALAGEHVIYEWTMPTPDGPRYFQTSLSPLYDDHQEVIGLVGVGRDITALRQAKAALQESETRYKNLIEGAPDIVYAYSTRRGGLYYSQRVKDVLGYTPEQLLSQPQLWHNSIHPDDLGWVNEAIEAYEAGQNFEIEYRIVDAHGQEHWLLDRSIGRKQADGELIIEGIAADITRRKEAEAKLKRTLAEKEVLLKEIHHRVKNNLQIISSLLNLQSRATSDPNTLTVLHESRSRIRTMALIHEKLYRSESLAQVDFLAYARDLATYLFRSHQAHRQGVRLEVAGDPVLLDINTLVPCGLIINELITNALKYAFPAQKQGVVSIRIQFVPPDQCRLVIADNGAGLPEAIDMETSSSLGLQLIYSLTQQLAGTLAVEGDDGARFVITFAGAALADDT